ERPAAFDGAVKPAGLPAHLLTRAKDLAGHSSDWWRQVGAIAWRGERVLGEAWNRHCPTQYPPSPPRHPPDPFTPLLPAARSPPTPPNGPPAPTPARAGTPLAGATLYAPPSPCPACPRLIAESGFRRCYFSGGYSVLDGESVLRAAGVELLWVDAEAS